MHEISTFVILRDTSTDKQKQGDFSQCLTKQRCKPFSVCLTLLRNRHLTVNNFMKAHGVV